MSEDHYYSGNWYIQYLKVPFIFNYYFTFFTYFYFYFITKFYANLSQLFIEISKLSQNIYLSVNLFYRLYSTAYEIFSPY